MDVSYIYNHVMRQIAHKSVSQLYHKFQRNTEQEFREIHSIPHMPCDGWGWGGGCFLLFS